MLNFGELSSLLDLGLAYLVMLVLIGYPNRLVAALFAFLRLRLGVHALRHLLHMGLEVLGHLDQLSLMLLLFVILFLMFLLHELLMIVVVVEVVGLLLPMEIVLHKIIAGTPVGCDRLRPAPRQAVAVHLEQHLDLALENFIGNNHISQEVILNFEMSHNLIFYGDLMLFVHRGLILLRSYCLLLLMEIIFHSFMALRLFHRLELIHQLHCLLLHILLVMKTLLFEQVFSSHLGKNRIHNGSHRQNRCRIARHALQNILLQDLIDERFV